MDTTLDYSIRLEDKRGILMRAPLEVTWHPSKNPEIRILDWQDLGEVKQGVDLEDASVLEEIYSALQQAATWIGRRWALLDALPLGGNVLFANCEIPDGHGASVQLFVETRCVEQACPAPFTRMETDERIDDLHVIRCHFELGWSNDEQKVEMTMKYGRDWRMYRIEERAQRRKVFLECLRGAMFDKRDLATLFGEDQEAGTLAVQKALQKVKQEVQASVVQFGETFYEMDDEVGEGLGDEGVRYYLSYVDMGIESDKGRLEMFAYVHIVYEPEYWYYDLWWN